MAKRKGSLHGAKYEAQDQVSVWVGTFPSHRDFVAYFEEHWSERSGEFLRCQFWREMGIRWTDHDFQETVYESRPLRVSTLLSRPISWIESFRTPLLQQCRLQGIEKVNTVAMLFEYAYPATVRFKSRYLNFLGSFPYSTGGRPMRRNR